MAVSARKVNLSNFKDGNFYLNTDEGDGSRFSLKDISPYADLFGHSSWFEQGIINITEQPYFADNTGSKDVTSVIQEAVRFAIRNQMVVYFPVGTYLVSDTIDCIQGWYIEEGTYLNPLGRNFPAVLVGECRNGQRPWIVLKESSKGFGNREKPKPVIRFRTAVDLNSGLEENVSVKDLVQFGIGEQYNDGCINMNQMLIGINIKIGVGNRGAVGIYARAAQGSGIWECRIEVGDGFAGIYGGTGSGGMCSNLEITGGAYGLYYKYSQPESNVVGIRLTGQTEAAIYYAGRQSLCITGFVIEKQKRAAVVNELPETGNLTHSSEKICPTDTHGSIVLTDGSIFGNVKYEKIAAICSDAGIYCRNVFVHGYSEILSFEEETRIFSGEKPWTWLQEIAIGKKAIHLKCRDNNLFETIEQPIYLNGKKQPDSSYFQIGECEKAPEDLIDRHICAQRMLGFWTEEAVNVKHMGAFGDGIHDDYQVLQRLIDTYDILYLPRGIYCVSQTLKLRPNSKLIGLYKCFTWIRPHLTENHYFGKEGGAPVLETRNKEEADTCLAFLGIYSPITVPGNYCLKWQCGGTSSLYHVNFELSPNWGQEITRGGCGTLRIPETLKRKECSIQICGNAGGRWYGWHQESIGRHEREYAHMWIHDVKGPLHFYQFNPEHCQGAANVLIERAKNITIYGLKSEPLMSTALTIRNSEGICILGTGGIYPLFIPGESIFKLEQVKNITIASLIECTNQPNRFQAGYHRSLIDDDGVTLPYIEKPILYKKESEV